VGRRAERTRGRASGARARTCIAGRVKLGACGRAEQSAGSQGGRGGLGSSSSEKVKENHEMESCFLCFPGPCNSCKFDKSCFLYFFQAKCWRLRITDTAEMATYRYPIRLGSLSPPLAQSVSESSALLLP
jgi:hypothetical protein